MASSMIDLADNIEVTTNMQRSLPIWRQLLSQECQVYVFGENYIAKRFDQINYMFCNKETAKEILIDNLYALLRFKYFKQATEEIDDRIAEIIKSFTVNLKSTLRKITFDKKTDGDLVRMLPAQCLAFKNGVYDFKNNTWLFKYEIIDLPHLSNRMYLYTYEYVVLWYFNFDFEPLPVDLNTMDLTDFVELFKDITKEERNYCFELLYNMSHNEINEFSYDKFVHLCEICGYTICQDFIQAFVFFIGSGGNGKNSLFDGCFTSNVVPRPTSNSLEDIENDDFITGTLFNHYQNIYLETDPKIYTQSKELKNTTGSPYQTIHIKGVQKFSSYVNCKHIFAANDQENVKFSDTTTGFRRRANFYEVWFSWDEDKRFMRTGDYYDTSFSEDLREITSNAANTIAFIYFGMYGIKISTNNFTKTFKFTKNDWKLQYTDIDLSLEQSMNNISINNIIDFLDSDVKNLEDTFFDENQVKLYKSSTMQALGCHSIGQFLKLMKDDELRSAYFTDNDAYISVKQLHKMIGYTKSQTQFSQGLKKLYNLKTIARLPNNQPVLKCTFVGKKFRIIN